MVMMMMMTTTTKTVRMTVTTNIIFFLCLNHKKKKPCNLIHCDFWDIFGICATICTPQEVERFPVCRVVDL